MAPFIATVTVCKEGGNAAELRRGEEEHDLDKEGARLVQFLTMAWEVGGSLAQHSGVRWTVAALPAQGRRKGREGACAWWANCPIGSARGDGPDGQ
jgi:hypothetical protein